MLRIGDAAKIFDISKRTLRYWEDEGILRSVRADNGYRYYDADNAIRIRQIVLLRKLKMPIAEIERIAPYRAESEAPEQDCAAVMNRFVLENELHKKSGFRHFGFNNPNPSEDTPVYGYEMWVSVPEGFAVPVPLTQKDFAGGLYASIVASLGDIDERWQQLGDWVTKSVKYEASSSVICMEECLDFETLASGSGSEMQLDLLLPVKERTGGKT